MMKLGHSGPARAAILVQFARWRMPGGGPIVVRQGAVNAPSTRVEAMQRPISRRAALAAAFSVAAATGAARAQAWPSRPLRILVPAVPGGATDIVTRAVAQPMGEWLGQSVVAENRAGGSGLVALDVVMSSPPDGYTLLLVTEGNPMGPNMYKDWKPDPVRSLEYITLLGRGMFIVLVHPSFPASTLADLIEHARRSPQPTSSTPACITMLRKWRRCLTEAHGRERATPWRSCSSYGRQPGRPAPMSATEWRARASVRVSGWKGESPVQASPIGL